MKELSIEEKARRYDETINAIKELKAKHPTAHVIKNWIKENFPELVESEDERIRKSLIEHLKECRNNTRSEVMLGEYAKWIAWLEKQCEKELVTCPICGCEFEKQGEQKPIPKHKVGDTIYYNSFGEVKSMIVANIVTDSPMYEDIEGNAVFEKDLIEQNPAWSEDEGKQKQEVNIQINPSEYINDMGGNGCYLKNTTSEPTDKVEPKFKVGDWIIHNKNIELANSIMLVTGKDDNEYLCNYRDGQCSYNIEFIDKEYRLWTIQDAKDGDVLSYVTDEEDLWIMIYWSLYEPYEGHVHYHTLLYNDNFSDKGTCCICIDNLKPATKEQRNTLFAKMKETGYEWDAENKQLKKEVDNLHDYLYGEQNPAWTEEDERTLSSIYQLIDFIPTSDSHLSKEQKEICLNWLKFLKERYTWKPSDEQMNTLEQWLKDNQYKGDARYCYPIFESLYDDLKKLKQ